MRALFTFIFITISYLSAQSIDSTKWEYLIIGVSKVSYTNLLIDSSSSSMFKQASGIIGKTESEALTVERILDAQGKEGWELVNAVGAIGGAREFIFKRKLTIKYFKKDN